MIESHPDVRAFFRERVVSALQSQGLSIAGETEAYLVDLMTRFAVSGRMQDITTPLAQLFAGAVAASGFERLRRFCDLGDIALFVSGFFNDSFDRRGLSPGYVTAMGGQAYWTAGRLARAMTARQRTSPAEVYVELADRFDDCSRVLDDVREQTQMRTKRDVLRLYERWLRTGSPRLAERLQGEGLFPQLPLDDELN